MRAPKLLRMFSRFVEYMGPNGFVIMRVPIPMYQFFDWDSYIKIATLGLGFAYLRPSNSFLGI